MKGKKDNFVTTSNLMKIFFESAVSGSLKVEDEQMGGDGQYTGSYDQNVFMLDYLKTHRLKKGSKSAHDGLTLTDEEGLGSEVIFSKKYGTLRKLDAGDMVFNKDQVEKLWNLSKGITTPNMYMDNLGARYMSIIGI